MDKDQQIWMTDWGNGLFRFDTKNKDYTLFKCLEETENSKSCLNAAGIGRLTDSKLMIFSHHEPIFAFDRLKEEFSMQVFQTKGLQPKNPSGSFMDSQGNTWFYTNGNGLYKLPANREVFTRISVDGNVRDIIQVKEADNMIIATDEGYLFEQTYDGKVIQKIKNEKYRPNESPGIIDLDLDESQQIWALGAFNVYKVDLKNAKLLPLEFPAWQNRNPNYGYHWTFTIDADNDIWIASQNGGLGKVSPDSQRALFYKFDIEDPNSLQMIIVLAASLWIVIKIFGDPQKEYFA